MVFLSKFRLSLSLVAHELILELIHEQKKTATACRRCKFWWGGREAVPLVCCTKEPMNYG
jgi:hypothetical protein